MTLCLLAALLLFGNQVKNGRNVSSVKNTVMLFPYNIHLMNHSHKTLEEVRECTLSFGQCYQNPEVKERESYSNYPSNTQSFISKFNKYE